jgi:hypothetical protein
MESDIRLAEYSIDDASLNPFIGSAERNLINQFTNRQKLQ